mgnify:CR=1 FL=1
MIDDDFRRRWGLPEEDFDKRFQKTVYRVLVITGNDIEVEESKLKTLAYTAGASMDTYVWDSPSYGWAYFDVKKYLLGAKQPPELAEKIENLLKCYGILNDSQKERVVNTINDGNIGIRVSKDKKGNYITYPQGEPMLDEKVVDRALLSLDGKSASEYENALEAYDSGRWNESSNGTRRALEEYLKQYLNNKKGLKANIKTIGSVLKESGVAEHFCNSIINQLRTLDSHYNSGSKHNSKTQGATEAEYLIYSVGVVVNTLEQLKVL